MPGEKEGRQTGRTATSATVVAELMRQRIEHYLATRSDPSLYQSVRNMSQFVSDDYGNRFLIELIQNAHDAHDPLRSDGEIAVVLDASEGPHGCLYVANRGVGFVRENLKAITNIALSSKPVNAGIGNKGLGFRSVLQVCNWPEVYSVQGAGGSGHFDGYCFRFATLDDFREKLGIAAEELAQEMARNLPCWHVPVPVEPCASVERFARDGFATVVRLPLKSSDALEAVRSQINVLLGLQTPLNLFLERVGRISIDAGAGEIVALERSVQATWTLDPSGLEVGSPLTIANVRLGTEDLIVAHCEIDEQTFREALNTSLERGEVPESWRQWEGAARVSVAVPLGKPLEAGRLYCFLPLGSEGKAPFAGYINANFYTKMDRREVDASILLNDLFMRTAAWISCQLIGFLVESSLPDAPSAVVSLLCWDDKYLDTLKQAMGDEEEGILSREFLPVRGAGDTVAWASPKVAYSWVAPPDVCLSPRRICEVGGGRILVESLTESQRAGLDALYMRLRRRDFKPPATLVAEWVEKIAAKMREEGASPERWASFYDEVSVALAGQPAVLFGKRFLLSVSGELISSEVPVAAGTGRGRRAADVYFAPVLSVDAEEDDDDSKRSLPLESLPATLRKGFALLSRDIPWLKDDGGHRPGRSFLIAGKLAREYDTRDVLRTLAGVTRAGGADRAREQALEWAFRLWNSGRSLSDRETRSAGFSVPTAAGWVEAEAAMFGAGWDTPNGKKLQTLLTQTSESSEDLRQASERLLPDFVAWPIRHGAQDDWIRFLTATGVTDCLRPVGGDGVLPEPSGNPANLVPAVMHAVPGMSDGLRAHWREQLRRDCARMYPSRPYKAELRPWRVPGQGDVDRFPAEVRRDYAVQVVYAMRSFAEEHRSFRAIRADYGAVVTEPHRLSTPLFAFLTGAEWMPVVRPGGQIRFLKPSDAWYFNADDDRPPRFLDFVAHQVAAALDPPTLEWLQRHAQLGVFNDERHAERALLALAHAASPGIADVRDVRRFRDLFGRLWATVRRDAQPAAAQCVPVLVAGQIVAVSRNTNEIVLAYFDDERDALRRQLLEELGQPVFDFVRGDPAAAWQWVDASAPERFQKISDEPAEIFVDGAKFSDSTPTRLLSEIIGSWIVDFFVCAAEHKGSSFVQPTQKMLGRIRRTAMSLGVIIGREVRIGHGDERVPLPQSLHAALALDRPSGPVLILQASEGELTLSLLAAGAGQLAVALGFRELANGLDAALLRLSAALRELPGEAPDDTVLAAALGVEIEAIKLTRRLASGDLIGMLDLAIPLSACLGEPETTARLLQLVSLEEPQEEELRAALGSLANALGLSLGELEERMMQLIDLADLKAEFGLPINRLNAAIAGLGGRYKPLSNEQLHREVWARHLRQRQPVIAERLRERAAGLFDRVESLSKYAMARGQLLSLEPDAAWFEAYDELPEPVMEVRIAKWVEDAFPIDASDTPLTLTLNETRSVNGARLRQFWSDFTPILSAWVRDPGTSASAEVRNVWSDPDAMRETCFARIRDSGWMDFRLLDDHQIARWLTLEGIWPADRVANADPAAWGLSIGSVATSEERAKAERAEQQRRRTQVDFAGAKLSALKEGYGDLAAAIIASAAQAAALQHVSPTDAPLVTMEPSRPSGAAGGGSGRGVPKSPESGMSDEQKMAVGLMGELWAREWLRLRHHLDVVDESIWVSGYRDTVLHTSGGSDGLGYDFIVATKSRTYYYEVKASTGDPLRFEMGPTEIGAAQRFRADREHRYRVLYLAYVGDPARLTARLLANPFSAKGIDKFRAVGKGSVVYQFEPTG